jgi:hypothetical protein
MTVLLFAIAFLLGNIYKVSVFSPEIKISFLDLLVIIYVLRHISAVRKTLHSGLLPFLVWSFFTLILAWPVFGLKAFLVGGLYLARFTFYGLFAWFIPKKSARLLDLLMWVIVISCLFQYLIFPDVRSLAVSEWDPHYYRVVGSFLDPGFTGLILLFTLIYNYFHKYNNVLCQRIIFILNYLVFALTYSRSSILAAWVVVIYLALLQRSWRFFLLGTLLLGSTLFILPRAPGGEGVKLERTSSIEARIINWQNSWKIFSDHPLFGVGFNVYRYAQKNYGFLDSSVWLKSHAGAGADSSLLFVAATSGLIVLLLYLYFLFSLWHQNPSSVILHSSLVALFVHSLFLNSLFYPFILFWLALLIVNES